MALEKEGSGRNAKEFVPSVAYGPIFLSIGIIVREYSCWAHQSVLYHIRCASQH